MMPSASPVLDGESSSQLDKTRAKIQTLRVMSSEPHSCPSRQSNSPVGSAGHCEPLKGKPDAEKSISFDWQSKTRRGEQAPAGSRLLYSPYSGSGIDCEPEEVESSNRPEKQPDTVETSVPFGLKIPRVEFLLASSQGPSPRRSRNALGW